MAYQIDTSLHVAEASKALRAALLGAPLGAFLIGRPFPLFPGMFGDPAAIGNPCYDGTVSILQALSKAALMAAQFLLLVHGTVGRLAQCFAGEHRSVETLRGHSHDRAPTIRPAIGWWGTHVVHSSAPHSVRAEEMERRRKLGSPGKALPELRHPPLSACPIS
jgi:hypothetical protein